MKNVQRTFSGEKENTKEDKHYPQFSKLFKSAKSAKFHFKN